MAISSPPVFTPPAFIPKEERVKSLVERLKQRGRDQSLPPKPTTAPLTKKK